MDHMADGNKVLRMYGHVVNSSAVPNPPNSERSLNNNSPKIL
jgi:hypothetical protein